MGGSILMLVSAATARVTDFVSVIEDWMLIIFNSVFSTDWAVFGQFVHFQLIWLFLAEMVDGCF
jgi:hypothetical protein